MKPVVATSTGLVRITSWILKAVTAAIALAVVLFVAVLLLIKGRPVDDIARNPVTRFVATSVRFTTRLRDRHPLCNLSETWRLSGPAQYLASRQIEASLKVLRSDGPYTLVRTPLGDVWMPARDLQTISESLLDQREGIYEPGDSGVQRGDNVLDCGANIGLYTKYALTRGAGRVIAIEVAPEAIECLRRNFAEEVLSGAVTVYTKGVWDRDAVLRLESPPELSSMGASVSSTGTAGPVVQVTTIDRIVSELNLQRVDFIKMDIEGAEANALRGATETLRRFRPRMAIALEHNRSDLDAMPLLIQGNWPSYRLRFSACAEKGGGARIQPAVLYAR